MKSIFLDSTPLGLLMTKPGHRQGDECRSWLMRHLGNGARVIVPEIIDYELRRELLRLGNTSSIKRLDLFSRAESDRYLAVTTPAIQLAAELWAQSRRRGTPTADPHSLDIDVILSAQVLTAPTNASDRIVATSNLGHLSQFVPAQLWHLI